MTAANGFMRKTGFWAAGILCVVGALLTVQSAQAQASRLPARPGLATRAPSTLQRSGGTVEGYVFWEEGRVAYNPSVPCQDLQVEIDAITGTGLQKLATSNQLKFQQPVRHGPANGLCGYSFTGMPEGVALQVQVIVGGPSAARVRATGPFGAIGGLIKIPGGICNNTPSGATSSTNLESGWVGCGNSASNVNFQLLARNATLPRQNTTLLQPGTGGSRPMLLQPNPQLGAPAPSNGMLVPPVRPAIGTQAVAPAPNPQGTPVAKNPGPPSVGATRKSGPGSLNGGSRAITNITDAPSPASAPSALIGLLRKQGSLKVVSGQRTRYALAASQMRITQFRQQRGGGQISAGHTMAAPGSMASRMATSPTITRNLRIAYVPSDLLSPKENTECERQEAQGAAPKILRIDGKTTGINYSPDPKTNPHTIVGCGFGDGGKVDLLLETDDTYFETLSYTVNFNIESWNDHEIVASVKPDTSGVPDWYGDLKLEVKTTQSGFLRAGQFTSTKQAVLLTSIPQKESSLYQSGSPYFLSPVSNYYGLNGTLAVARQGLSGPLAGQDQFTLPLANGFVVDSTQTDLLVSDTNANVSSQAATVNGNTITVTFPVVAFQSGNSTVYYSIYGLKIWVTGPVGLNPLAP